MADRIEKPEVQESEAPVDSAPVAEEPTPSLPGPETPQVTPPAPPTDSLPSAGTVNVTGPAPNMLQGPTTPLGTAAYLKKASSDWAADLQNQHITPLTYNKLYEDKSTPGKIMTLFGIMMGGLGSGLTGQPNAALSMMDKVIQNDLDAQKTSKANAQNFLRLNQEHQFQEAQKGLYGSQTELADAQAKNVAFGTAHQQANIAALHTVQTKIVQPLIDAAAADPTNMAKQQQAKNAQAAFGIAAQGLDAANSNITDKTSAITGMLNASSPQSENPPQGANDSGVDQKGLLQQITANKYDPKIGMNPQQASEAYREAQLVQGNRLIFNNYQKAFSALDSKYLAGTLNPGDRDAFVAPIKDQIAKQYNLGEASANELANSLFPTYKDWGAARRDKLQQGAEHFKSLEATPTLDQFKLKTPFPKPSAMEKQPSSSPKEGSTGKTKDGTPVIYKNGKWVTQ